MNLKKERKTRIRQKSVCKKEYQTGKQESDGQALNKNRKYKKNMCTEKETRISWNTCVTKGNIKDNTTAGYE